MVWLILCGALAFLALVALVLVIKGAYDDRPRNRRDAPPRDMM